MFLRTKLVTGRLKLQCYAIDTLFIHDRLVCFPYHKPVPGERRKQKRSEEVAAAGDALRSHLIRVGGVSFRRTRRKWNAEVWGKR